MEKKIYAIKMDMCGYSILEYPHELLQDLGVEKIFNGKIPCIEHYRCDSVNRDIIKRYIIANLALKEIKVFSLSERYRYYTLCNSKNSSRELNHDTSSENPQRSLECSAVLEDPIDGDQYMLLFINGIVLSSVNDSIKNKKREIDEKIQEETKVERDKENKIFMDYIEQAQSFCNNIETIVDVDDETIENQY